MLMVISPIDNSSTHRHLVMYVCFHFRQNWPAYDITTCHHMTKCWDKCLAGHSDLVIHIRWLAERHTECLAGHSDLVIHIRWLAERHAECFASHSDLVIYIRWLAERHTECLASHSGVFLLNVWMINETD